MTPSAPAGALKRKDAQREKTEKIFAVSCSLPTSFCFERSFSRPSTSAARHHDLGFEAKAYAREGAYFSVLLVGLVLMQRTRRPSSRPRAARPRGARRAPRPPRPPRRRSRTSPPRARRRTCRWPSSVSIPTGQSRFRLVTTGRNNLCDELSWADGDQIWQRSAHERRPVAGHPHRLLLALVPRSPPH